MTDEERIAVEAVAIERIEENFMVRQRIERLEADLASMANLNRMAVGVMPIRKMSRQEVGSLYPAPICECGATKAGDNQHSSWCPVAK